MKCELCLNIKTKSRIKNKTNNGNKPKILKRKIGAKTKLQPDCWLNDNWSHVGKNGLIGFSTTVANKKTIPNPKRTKKEMQFCREYGSKYVERNWWDGKERDKNKRAINKRGTDRTTTATTPTIQNINGKKLQEKHIKRKTQFNAKREQR